MDSLARAVEAADGPWPVIAIGLIGVYVLVWRFGGQILATVREINTTATAAHTEARSISESILTNHGSKNLGDAVDRLYETVQDLRSELGSVRDDLRVTQERIDERFETIESKLL